MGSFVGKNVPDILASAQKSENAYPFDYRFRNRPVRAAIEMAQAHLLAISDIQPQLLSSYKTDPLDLELVWNIGIWLKETGNLEGARNVLSYASHLAPGNALIARAVTELTPKEKPNGE